MCTFMNEELEVYSPPNEVWAVYNWHITALRRSTRIWQKSVRSISFRRWLQMLESLSVIYISKTFLFETKTRFSKTKAYLCQRSLSFSHILMKYVSKSRTKKTMPCMQYSCSCKITGVQKWTIVACATYDWRSYC